MTAWLHRITTCMICGRLSPDPESVALRLCTVHAKQFELAKSRAFRAGVPMESIAIWAIKSTWRWARKATR